MSNVNLSNLDPESPEYEAALEAAQRAEDEAIGNVDGADLNAESDPSPHDAPTGDDQALSDDTPAPASAPAAHAPAATEKPAGVLSKDGTKVLPYAALKGAREEARLHREARQAAEARAAELEQRLNDAIAGKKPTQADDELTPERIEEMIADFPGMAPLVKRFVAAQEELKKLAPAAAPAPAAKEEDDPIQDAIDSIPLLATWQSTKEDAPKWKRAVAIDKVLMESPKWANKSDAERFKEVTRMVADEFDIPFDDDTTSQQDTPPAKQGRQTPSEAIKAARRTTPNTLSDFKGGATDPSVEPITRLPAQRQLARVQDMDDDQIEAWLRKTGG